MTNLLIFDSSTENIVVAGVNKDRKFLHIRKFERSLMSRELPQFFNEISSDIKFETAPVIFIGSGPGPFTGLKTGVSFFLGYLYSSGFTKVNLVSSFLIHSLLSKISEKIKLVVISFNKSQYFMALIDKRNKFVIKDVFIKSPDDPIFETFKNYLNSEVLLIQAGCRDDRVLTEKLAGMFCNITVFNEKHSFEPECFFSLTNYSTVDTTTEPFILDHVLQPAGIDEKCDIYISDTKEELMKPNDLSVEVINEKLAKLREEHAKFDELSDTLAAKKTFTAHDEIELNTLRKKKLQKKDMINYYENLLKTAK